MESFHDARPDLLSSNALEVDEQSGNHLKDAGQWAKAIAVIACIVGGIATLAVLALAVFSAEGLDTVYRGTLLW